MKISEIFFSLQGEGLYIGLPTVFIRTFACDLRCKWCDTMYAVRGKDFREMNVEEVVSEVEHFSCPRVCITGGEPLIQKDEVSKISKILIEKGYEIILETSGHKTPPELFFFDPCIISVDCKCPSSRMEKKMDFSLYEKLREKDQIKFVIADKIDFEYASKTVKDIKTKATIIFQPVNGKNLTWIAESVLKHNLNNVRVLPQLHKIIWGNKRGV